MAKIWLPQGKQPGQDVMSMLPPPPFFFPPDRNDMGCSFNSFYVFWTILELAAFLTDWLALGGEGLVGAMQVWHPKKVPLCMIYLKSFLETGWNLSILTKCQSFRLGNHMAHLSQEKDWSSSRFGSLMGIGSPERSAQADHFLPCSRRKVPGPPSGPGLINLVLWFRRSGAFTVCQLEF